MKTLRWTCAALLVAALSGCFFYNYGPSPAVDLEASATWIVTGEDVLLSADASDAMGDDLSYEWYEGGERIVGANDAGLTYRTWADGTRRYVTVSVTVRDGLGRSASDSIDLTVDPSVSGTVVLFNRSSHDVWYFRSRLNDVAWLGDQLGSDILPSGASYVFPGYSTNWYDSWDFKAESFGGTPWWLVENFTFNGPGDVYFLTITD